MMKPSGFKLKAWYGRSWIIGTVPDPQLLNLTRMTRIRKLNLAKKNPIAEEYLKVDMFFSSLSFLSIFYVRKKYEV